MPASALFERLCSFSSIRLRPTVVEGGGTGSETEGGRWPGEGELKWCGYASLLHFLPKELLSTRKNIPELKTRGDLIA